MTCDLMLSLQQQTEHGPRTPPAGWTQTTVRKYLINYEGHFYKILFMWIRDARLMEIILQQKPNQQVTNVHCITLQNVEEGESRSPPSSNEDTAGPAVWRRIERQRW